MWSDTQLLAVQSPLCNSVVSNLELNTLLVLCVSETRMTFSPLFYAIINLSVTLVVLNSADIQSPVQGVVNQVCA